VKFGLRLLLVLVGSTAYLGLAVLGWNGLSAFLANPARLALAVVLLVMTAAALFAGGNVSPGVREDRTNRWVITAFTMLGLLDGYLPAYTDRIDFWTIDAEPVRWVGVVVLAVGGAFRIWPVFVLGNRFSGLVAIQPGHALVTTGIYRYIRHPSYLGLLLTALGWALGFRAGVGVLLAGLMLLVVLARIRSEERLLLAQFGEDYAAYRARTSRLIPGIF
jgi:protein-S-isoprenylcysteine O-methyltransferase Ste14